VIGIETLTLPVALYGCEIWPRTLREGHRFGVFEKRVLRGKCGPTREEVARGWRRLHNEELHNLYATPNIIRVIKSRRTGWAGHTARMGWMRNTYIILVRKRERKRPLRRPRRRWDDNIRMDLREVDWEGVILHLSGSGYGPVTGSCEQGNEPSGSIQGGGIS
jgi:hypothetical protein